MSDRSTAAIGPAGAVAAAAADSALMPLTVRGLTYQAGDKSILDNIDLDLSGSALTVLLGPNGAGKSVLMRLLHGLLKPTRGTVLWNGQPPADDLRRRQALVFQRPVLLRRSVAANIDFALALRAYPDRRQRLARALQLAGLNHLASQPARLLSGGEQQRLALARALVLEPEVLLLDEPTVSLDPASVLAIEDLIGAARRSGIAVILVTHELNQARRMADQVVFLHNGRIAEVTPAGRFFDTPASDEGKAYVEGRIVL